MRLFRSVLWVAIGAAASWLLWTAEVRWIRGWAGTAWLAGFNVSALPICALIALTSSVCAGPGAEPPGRLKLAAFAWAASVAAFALARWAAFELFAEGVPGRAARVAGLAAALAGLVLVSAGLPFAARRWLGPAARWTGAALAFALLLVLPLSFATIKVIPAVNGSTDEIHAIKMGYPVLWTALLVPAVLGLARRPQALSSKKAPVQGR